MTVFGGFPEGRDITYSVKNGLHFDQSVALYCNVSLSNPPPTIVWVDDFNYIIDNDQFHYIYLDSGQYLVVTWIDSFIAQRVFHCRVTNVIGMLSVDSPTRYRFNITGESSSFPVHVRRCVPSSPQLPQGLVWSSTNHYKMSLLLKEIQMSSSPLWLLISMLNIHFWTAGLPLHLLDHHWNPHHRSPTKDVWL